MQVSAPWRNMKGYRMHIHNYDVSIHKTRHSLPDLQYDEVSTLIELIEDYVESKYSNCVGYSYGIIYNIIITLNATEDTNCCRHNFKLDNASVCVSYKYSPVVRLWLLAHELTHALYPITINDFKSFSNRSHDFRPQEKLANAVADYITGIDYNKMCELASKYNQQH